MKRFLFCLLGAALITAAGCSSSSPTSPESGQRGSVAFKLEKATIPQGVVTVEALLTRSGYDSLAATVDVQTDTSATLRISDIPAGQWHLSVNAMDGSGNILYTGEADIAITAGTTTQLSLTLQPVSQGTGSISITVNWGTGGVYFTDYSENPVFTPADNPSSPLVVAEPKIIYQNGTYKMWYLSLYHNGFGNLWYAESNDGINWTNETSTPVLDTTSDAWDRSGLATGSVLKDSTGYRIYYNAYTYSHGQTQVGLAVSTDGIHWEKYPNPVLSPSGPSDYYMGVQTVLKVNGEYYLYYNFAPSTSYTSSRIGVATSSDGISWTRSSNNPILSPTFPWEGDGITYPSVIYDNGQFVMIYANSVSTDWGIAYSTDGIHWIKGSTEPVFTAAQSVNGTPRIGYPFLLKTADGYRIYYTNYPSSDQGEISFAQSPNIR